MSETIFDIESERAALAIVLSGNEKAWPQLIGIIGNINAFYHHAHQLIAVACARVFAEHGTPDAMTVYTMATQISYSDAITQLRILDGVDNPERLPKLPHGSDLDYSSSIMAAIGAATISEIATINLHDRDLSFYSVKIAEHHHQRKSISALQSALDLLSKPSGPKSCRRILDDLFTKATAQGVSNHEGTVGEGVKRALQVGDYNRANPSAGTLSTWGIKSLDETVPLAPGAVTTLAATTGGGKTSLALTAIEATARACGAGSVAYVSMEMSRLELGAIFLARRLGTSSRVILDGGLNVGQRDVANDFAAEYDRLGIAVRDAAPRNTPGDVESWARQRQALTGGRLRLLVVDHMGLLDPDNKRELAIGAVIAGYKSIKRIAMMLNIHIMAINQYNREGAKADRARDGTIANDPRPRLQDLRGTGEQDSDQVVLLWRPDAQSCEPRQRRVAVCAKVRSGPTADVELLWEPGRGQRFSDPTVSHAHEDSPDDRLTRYARMYEQPPEAQQSVF